MMSRTAIQTALQCTHRLKCFQNNRPAAQYDGNKHCRYSICMP